MPLALVVIVRARRDVPTTAAHVRGALDVAGIVALATGLLAAMIALTRLDAQAATFGGPMLPVVCIVVAVVAFVALAFIEPRAAEPVIPPALFAKRQLAVTYALEVLIGALEGALFFVPAALVAAQHLSYAVAGMVAAVGAVVFVAVIPAAGRALDLVGSRMVLSIGSVLTALGLAALGLTLSVAAARDRVALARRRRLRRLARRADALHHHQRDAVADARHGRRPAQHLPHRRPDPRRLVRGRHRRARGSTTPPPTGSRSRRSRRSPS